MNASVPPTNGPAGEDDPDRARRSTSQIPRHRGRRWTARRTLLSSHRRRGDARPHSQRTRPMDILKTFFNLLTPRERRNLSLLFCAVLVMAGLEVVSVGSILPFLQAAADPASVHENAYLSWAYETVGFADTNSFLIALGWGRSRHSLSAAPSSSSPRGRSAATCGGATTISHAASCAATCTGPRSTFSRTSAWSRRKNTLTDLRTRVGMRTSSRR